MKQKIIIILSIIFTSALNAQYTGPIPEITTGYGSFGIYANDTMLSFENTTVASNVLEDRTVSIFYSKAISLPAPTVMIAPGWEQFDPNIFEHLIDFIVSKGCVVVYAPTQSNGGHWFDNHYSGMQMAIDNYSNIIDTTQIGIFGHSVGGGAVVWLGKKLFMDKNYGLNGRFMFASSAWINFEITQTDLINFPQDVALIMQYYEEDTGFVSPNGTDPRFGIDIYNNINIPASEKDFIMVNSSDIDGYHYTTDHGIYSNAPYNALDYYGLFKHIDALIDYKFNGNCAAKYICLGNGGSAQIDMGQMNSLTVNEDIVILPQSHYDYPCNSGSNPRSAYCNETLHIEPFIEYIDSVFINDSSCSILDTGIFFSTETNEHYCDSIVTTFVSLLPASDTLVSQIIYNILDTGTIVYEFTNQFGCDSTYTVISKFLDTTTAIISLNENIFIVQNPVINTLSLQNINDIQRIELVNLNGKVVLVKENNFSNIDVKYLEKSIYFLKFTQIKICIYQKYYYNSDS